MTISYLLTVFLLKCWKLSCYNFTKETQFINIVLHITLFYEIRRLNVCVQQKQEKVKYVKSQRRPNREKIMNV